MLSKLGLGVVIGAALVLWSGGLWAETSRNVNLRQAAEQFVNAGKVAVVVGVNNYDNHSGLRPLRFAVNDAQIMAQTLRQQGYTVLLLTDHKANREYILDAIEQAGKAVHAQNGTLLFFFSGHGFAEGQNNYLASYGTVSNRLQGSALRLAEVEQAIRQTQVKRAVMLVDACRDNPFVGKSVASPSFLRQNSEGIKALYATKPGELSYETPQLGRGVFTHFLVQGLRGQAVEVDGAISFESLTQYVQEQTAQWTLQHLQKTQLPYAHAWSGSFGVFVLGQVGQRPLLPPVPTPQPVVRPTPTPPPQPVPRTNPAPVSAQARVIEPQMVNIPAGTFTMGCVAGRDDVEGGCLEDEKPPRTVQVGAFQLSKYEVTFDEYDACTATGACPRAADQGWGRGRRPVINVNWNDAQAYVRWLSQQTGKNYRLPSEAEWEYAARGGRNDTAYSWGNTIGLNQANCDGCGSQWDNKQTAPVGQFNRNAFGLHDMHGNVWEWVQDCWSDSYQAAPSDGRAREGGSCTDRVLRGGSWYDGPRIVRSAHRSSFTPDYRNGNVGFRPVQGQ